jgi:predicted small secreted protein
MKKLLLVLLVVTLASFLLVGCTGTTPAEGEGEGEGEAEAVIINLRCSGSAWKALCCSR